MTSESYQTVCQKVCKKIADAIADSSCQVGIDKEMIRDEYFTKAQRLIGSDYFKRALEDKLSQKDIT